MADKTERPTQEEILQALRTIKAVCENNVCYVGNCPFERNDCACCLQEIAPEDWVINDGEQWKAFLQ